MIKQSRKFLMTLNNPAEKGFDIDACLEKALSLKGLQYACLAMEIGAKEQTPHIHMFVYYQNPKSWDTMKKLIPKADWECCRGTCRQNRDYCFKLGKWIETEKGTTTVDGTQTEYGELPEERPCPKPELALLYELIKDGKSNVEILEEYPEYMLDITHIDRCRLILRQEEFKNSWRNLEVTYIYGVTGAGKSRYVMEKYGYSNVFRVTDYTHPFDTYNGEDILMLEEYNSSFKLQDALNYLDSYPLKLPARYSDKVACYTKVYITTNIALEKQYPVIKEESPELWNAFIRRINKVMYFKSKDEIITYDSTDVYFKRFESFHPVSEDEQAELPF